MAVARGFLNTLKSYAEEVRWRGLWGTVRALKLNKFGSHKYLVGEDEFGNRYFENNSEWYGRHRWVEYFEERHVAFDSVKVPPQWHAWISYVIDETPSKDPLPAPKYQSKVTGNTSGTKDMYISSYSPLSVYYKGHASGKIQAWDPRKPSRRTIPRSANQDDSGKDVLDLK
mmetsp:Transcript_18038/g.31322  ORF Transcript_18038/g.31322 Transcript_18038/m.31322 type:complete len:171 (+) Transcript_18038:107-619(+)|eukprot:CAMPEP_0184691498 /NCGR_PEP_ID=MMETSP0313-20130426/339_1 /TAXON_ID=2792 /ORGANISM="Porphyridium aerugineum, Strain SAG 1380-2" /LENGTH=170 /DNA_ID=CAMNT_0027149231 /DNA_START=106 /DNA_END=618 /DNA_ORIENTATION=+